MSIGERSARGWGSIGQGVLTSCRGALTLPRIDDGADRCRVAAGGLVESFGTVRQHGRHVHIGMQVHVVPGFDILGAIARSPLPSTGTYMKKLMLGTTSFGPSPCLASSASKLPWHPLPSLFLPKRTSSISSVALSESRQTSTERPSRELRFRSVPRSPEHSQHSPSWCRRASPAQPAVTERRLTSSPLLLLNMGRPARGFRLGASAAQRVFGGRRLRAGGVARGSGGGGMAVARAVPAALLAAHRAHRADLGAGEAGGQGRARQDRG